LLGDLARWLEHSAMGMADGASDVARISLLPAVYYTRGQRSVRSTTCSYWTDNGGRWGRK